MWNETVTSPEIIVYGRVAAFDPLQIISVLPDGALVLDVSGIVTMTNGIANVLLQLNAIGLQASAVIRFPSFAEALESVRQKNRSHK